MASSAAKSLLAIGGSFVAELAKSFDGLRGLKSWRLPLLVGLQPQLALGNPMSINAAHLFCVGLALSLACESHAQDTAVAKVTAVYSPANGIGPQEDVMRRDPSDIRRSAFFKDS